MLHLNAISFRHHTCSLTVEGDPVSNIVSTTTNKDTIMPTPRPIRRSTRSTSLVSVLPVLLMTLVIFSLFMAKLNLISITFRNANNTDDQHEPHDVIEETSMKGVMKQNEILPFNLNRCCRTKKPKEFEVTPSTFLQKGNAKSRPMLNESASIRQGGSMRHQVVHHLANKLADSGDDDGTQTMLINRELFN
ncbi:hypothetical protein GHT06_014434 [Daphnia sinensis]|uniref:Transmembrane protein n=1 Tax=Daphnia sinensis TaxID=1820382 RepID=A0AAD5PV72_9CRUS|nr:hypothetical protein GHT06_014434 [Daphnia sinensis]